MANPATPVLHPAAEWALGRSFTPSEVDCTTAVMLKILDGKCKMDAEKQDALMAIYDVLQPLAGRIFDNTTHQQIALARSGEEYATVIHELRLVAEALIPKPVMKGYKAMLQREIF